MTIKNSGSLAVSEIVTEFGGNTPHSFSEYYRGGSYVVSGITNPNGIPTSGPIAVSRFYGAAKKMTLVYVVGTNQTDLNIYSAAAVAGWNYVSAFDLVVTIQPGIYLGSSSTSTPALNTGSGYPAGTTITIVNNGYILGKGGAGGNGGYAGVNSTPGTSGLSGGPAMIIQTQITLQNNGVIAGGGGGGGGGGSTADSYAGPAGGCGGGGGQGFLISSGGAGTNYGPGGVFNAGGTSTGSPGSQTSAGLGGIYGSPYYGYMTGGNGGNGGSLGQAGSAGSYSSSNGNFNSVDPGGAGIPGPAISGNSNITWGAIGTIYGTIS